MLNLVKAHKVAVPTKFTDMPKEMAEKIVKEKDQLAELKKMIRNAEKELGDKTIDGVKARGFQVRDDHMLMDIWVDAKTAMPIRIEGEGTAAKIKVVLSDIEFVNRIDPDLFSLVPPKGYKISMAHTVSLKPIDAKGLVSFLKAWNKIKGGTFPDTIYPGAFIVDAETYAKAFKGTGASPKENLAMLEQTMKTVAQGLVGAVKLIASNETFHYQGKGVKLGAKDTAILWYKPKDQNQYVVIFGDLNVKRMLENDLPKTSTEKTN
jgi:hypothetical protein